MGKHRKKGGLYEGLERNPIFHIENEVHFILNHFTKQSWNVTP